MPAISLAALALNFELENHDEYPRFLSTLSVSATDPVYGQVGTLSGYYIQRHMMNGQFLEIMDDESHDLQSFASALFDNSGILRPFLKEGFRRGAGCWGDELNDGMLVYVDRLEVGEAYRRQGIGSVMLQRLFERRDLFDRDNILCLPVSREGDPIPFYRANGFRRLGRTPYFGYSLNPDHPSRSLAAADDIQQSLHETYPPPPRPSYGDALFAGSTDPEVRLAEERRRDYPLHSAIATDKSANIATIIQQFYQRDPASIHANELGGFRPVHVAVWGKNIDALNSLLALGCVDDLSAYDNAAGCTPLELLHDATLRERGLYDAAGFPWPGFSETVLAMEYIMKQAMGTDFGSPNPQEYVAQRRFGCTCGQCMDGWLAPRMAYQLEVQAGFASDSMRMDFDFFEKRQALDPDRVLSLSNGEYIPEELHDRVYLTFYRGFNAMFSAAWDILQVRPTPTFNCNAVAMRATQAYTQEAMFYLQKGGRAQHAMKGIIEIAREQGIHGDREFFETFGDDERFLALPKCANDNDFGIVEVMTGVKVATPSVFAAQMLASIQSDLEKMPY